MKKAIIYIRASTNEELQKNSFGTQQNEIDAFCKTHGYTIEGTYKEYVSASKRVKRLQWDAAVDELKLDPELTLIAWELTRVSRDLKDWALLESLLHRIRFTDGPDEPPSFLELSMRLVIAQYETKKMGERISAGIRRKKDAALAQGKIFIWGNTHSMPNEHRKAGSDANVANADQFYDRLMRAINPVKGLTLAAQVEFLNNETRFRTRRGKKWSIANLHRAINR